MYTHLIEAKRTSARCPADTAHLSPRMHRKLVETVRAGSQIIETVIKSGLTDRDAYQLESRMIGEFHKFRAGQLWNTIDERFLDPQYLPEEWDDPEHPFYRLPRPLGNPQLTRGWAKSKTYQLWARTAGIGMMQPAGRGKFRASRMDAPATREEGCADALLRGSSSRPPITGKNAPAGRLGVMAGCQSKMRKPSGHRAMLHRAA
jgi:hypothetical protein